MSTPLQYSDEIKLCTSCRLRPGKLVKRGRQMTRRCDVCIEQRERSANPPKSILRGK